MTSRFSFSDNKSHGNNRSYSDQTVLTSHIQDFIMTTDTLKDLSKQAWIYNVHV